MTSASGELITIAERQMGGSRNVSFASHDLLDVTGLHGFVAIRMLPQHLENVEAVLDHAASITGPGALVLIIDAHVSLRSVFPDVPEFARFSCLC
jgi:hypothetical protein